MGARKGESGYCSRDPSEQPSNPDEVAHPNATEVLQHNYNNFRAGDSVMSPVSPQVPSLKTH